MASETGVESSIRTPLYATQELRRAVNEGGRKVATSRLFGSFCDGVIEVAKMVLLFGFFSKL